MREYLKVGDRIISGLLRATLSEQRFKTRVVVLDKSIKGGVAILPVDKDITIYMNPDAVLKNTPAEAESKLLSALILVKCGIAPDETGLIKLPEWFIAGIRGSIIHKINSSGISPIVYMPGLLASVRSGKIPELSDILHNPLSPKDGPAYGIYEEYCRFLVGELHSLSRNSDNAIADLIIMSAAGKYSPGTIFNSSAGRVILKRAKRLFRGKKSDNLSDSEMIQEWFKYALNRKFKNVFFPLPAKQISDEMQYFYNVPCLVKNDKGEIKQKKIKLYDLPKEQFLIEKPKIVLDKTDRMISEISNHSPVSVKKKLIKLQNSLSGSLSNPDRQLAAKNIANAMFEVEKAIEHQIKVEKFLKEIEAKMIPPGTRLQLEIAVDRIMPVGSPGYDKYLDSIEDKYFQ